MSGLLHHTKEIQSMTEQYLDDTKLITDESLARLRSSITFRQIYKTSLATDAVLSKLSTSKMRPNLKTLRSIDLRIPLLIAMRQTSIAIVELRRFTELCYWSIYFTDHCVEWEHFNSNPKQGYYNNIDNPISYCARRGMNFYSNYVIELMKKEPSGIAHKAVSSLRQISPELHYSVHPGSLAISRTKTPPVDDNSEQELKKFSKIQKTVFSNVCILLAAYSCTQFNKLPPMYRAYFDWLVGTKTKKYIRSSSFGLA